MERTLRFDMYSAKEAAILQYIRQTPESDKIIIYSFFTTVLERLNRVLNDAGFQVVMVTGKMKKTNSTHLEQFRSEDSSIKVLLMTLKVGSQGLTIITANHVLFTDPWWNPFSMEQAECRVQRSTQRKHVFIVYFIMDHTVEVCMINHTIRKKDTLHSFKREEGDIGEEGEEEEEDHDLDRIDEKSGIFDYKLDIVPSN
jgi:SNF2 family DNA or RNA helicase